MKLRTKFERLEDTNQHTDCAILLAKHFGTDEELDILNHIKYEHEKRGFIESYEIEERNNILNKYYKFI